MKIFRLIFVMLSAAACIAMGGGGGGHGSSPQQSVSIQYRSTGPVLKAYSKNAKTFLVSIDNIVHYNNAEEDGYLNFNLFPLNLSNGKHSVRITPSNEIGQAREIVFDLSITAKNPQLWQIVPDRKLIKEDTDYQLTFSNDLSIYVMPQDE